MHPETDLHATWKPTFMQPEKWPVCDLETNLETELCDLETDEYAIWKPTSIRMKRLYYTYQTW